MGSITIEGGHRLSGETVVQGAKNSVLPVLAATLLCGGACRIRRCPRLSDVDAAADILRSPDRQAQMKQGMAQLGIPDAAERIYKTVMALVR